MARRAAWAVAWLAVLALLWVGVVEPFWPDDGGDAGPSVPEVSCDELAETTLPPPPHDDSSLLVIGIACEP